MSTENKKPIVRPKVWSEFEDKGLISELRDRNIKFIDIAKRHGRSPIAIIMRVVDHLKLTDNPANIHGYDEYMMSPEYKNDLTKLEAYRARAKKTENTPKGEKPEKLEKSEKSEKSEKAPTIRELMTVIKKMEIDIEELKKYNAELNLRVLYMEKNI